MYATALCLVVRYLQCVVSVSLMLSHWLLHQPILGHNGLVASAIASSIGNTACLSIQSVVLEQSVKTSLSGG
jgi:hypothetical protein